VLAILAGKYAAASLIVDKLPDGMSQVSDASFISDFADDIVIEQTGAGKQLQWPAGKTAETAKQAGDYPPEIWQEANKKWTDLGPAGQQKKRDEAAAAFMNFAKMLRGQLVWMAFKNSFGPVDVIFFLLAIATAIKLGGGISNDD